MRNSVRREIGSKSGAAGVPSRTDSERVVTGIVCILLVAIVWIVFGQTLRHEFVNYDDDQYIYENPRVTNGLTSRGFNGPSPMCMLTTGILLPPFRTCWIVNFTVSSRGDII